MLEHLASTTGQFWTLTASDSNLDALAPDQARKSVRTFLEGLRRSEARFGNPQTIRFFGVLEYGEQLGRPHVHLLIWNLAKNLRPSESYKAGLPRPRWNLGVWPHGHVDIQTLNQKSVAYVCKYATKFHDKKERLLGGTGQQNIVFHPSKPPLGSTGLNLLVDEISRSPKSRWEQPNFIEIDGKTYPLDQTMQKQYYALLKKYGLKHFSCEGNPRDRARAKLLVRQDKDRLSIPEQQRREKQFKSKERLFDFYNKQHSLRSAQILSRAVLLATPRNATPDVSGKSQQET